MSRKANGRQLDKELMCSLFALSAMTTDPWIIIRSIMEGFLSSYFSHKQTSSSAHFTDSFDSYSCGHRKMQDQIPLFSSVTNLISNVCVITMIRPPAIIR